MTGTPPSARYCHSAIYDPVRDRMVVFGGLTGTVLPQRRLGAVAGGHAGVDAADAHGHAAERAVRPQRDLRPGARPHGGVRGQLDGPTLRNDVWALSLAGTPAWTQLTPTGTPPSARYGHSAIYDPVRDRMVVFGGYDGHPASSTTSGRCRWRARRPGRS